MPHGDHFHAHDDHHERPHPRAPTLQTISALKWGLGLTAGFAIVEAVGGWIAGSLALISDAGHMATDAASFVVALIAQHVARRPPSARASFGYARAEVLAAFINALALIALVVWIVVEAVSRLLQPVPVQGSVVMGVAIAGLGVNLFVAWMLSRARGSVNARGALLHVFGDILGSLAAIVAGSVIAFTGWTPIDPILSVVVALLILRSTIALLRETGGVLLERVPPHLSYDEVGRAISALPGVTGVHDLHIWTMSADRPALSAHVTLRDGGHWPEVLAAAQAMLASKFGIDHVTLQPTWMAGVREGVVPIVEQRGDGR